MEKIKNGLTIKIGRSNKHGNNKDEEEQQKHRNKVEIGG